MDETHALQYALCIAGALLTIIWGMIRQEAKKTSEALEKKATTISVDEVKANNVIALRDVKEHFQRIIDRNHSDYQERIRELNERQDREVDWLKEEIGKLGDNLQHMRQEQVLANQDIMRNIQQLATNLRGTK
jgi:hypothetical protein